MLLMFLLNGNEFVEPIANVRLPLVPGKYLCLKCNDHTTIFNPEELNLTERSGFVVSTLWTVFPEDNWVYVRLDADLPVVRVQTSNDDVKNALKEPSFRAIADTALRRAVRLAGALEFPAAVEKKRHRPEGLKECIINHSMYSNTPNDELDRLNAALIKECETQDVETQEYRE